jgi:uncharacterized protein (DUF433 family)
LFIEYKVLNWFLQGFFKADQHHSLQIHTLVGFKEITLKLKDIITIEPGKRGGKPFIRGMRITIYDVLDYLASGMSHEEILDDFPYLTEEDILACLKFASDG